MNPNNMYDITNYTDKQLFHILNLNQHPSDKELEASIILSINKYNHLKTEIGKTLTIFFNDIYDHFFESEYKNETNNENDSSIIESMDTIDSTTTPTNEGSTTTQPPRQIVYTNAQEQVRGSLNPLLKQTFKRIITIDSQYRDIEKYKVSTDFSFELSDTLKDVLSLKLYSINIPYSWYTISKDYGSNFFYLKGNSPGINNGYHDYKIEIEPGNYSTSDLITKINKSISELSNINTDTRFGHTAITYNSSTVFSTITVDITKIYNESDYYIDFIENPTGLNVDGLYTDIASFLGYTDSQINTNTVQTSHYTFQTSNTFKIKELVPPTLYELTELNNYFTIYQYSTTLQSNTTLTYSNIYNIDFIPNYLNHTIDFSFNVKLLIGGDGTSQLCTRTELVDKLQTSLQSSNYLNKISNIKIIPSYDELPSSHEIPSLFQLTLSLNKKKTVCAVNEKMFIKFPDETTNAEINDIWTNSNSCFLFNSLTYELNNITSQKTIMNTLYNPINAKIILTCNKNGYESPYNEYIFSITNPPSNINNGDGYNLNQYLSEINSAINNEIILKNQYQNDPVLLVSSLSSSALIDSTNISETTYLSFNFNFIKNFTKEYYVIDLDNTILYDLDNTLNTEINIYPNHVDSGDLSFNIQYNGSQYNITNNKPLLKIKSKINCGTENIDVMDISLNTSSSVQISETTIYYQNIDLLVLDIINSFQNYTDQHGERPLFRSIASFTTTPSTSEQTNILIKINLLITKKITQTDYNVTFQNLARITGESYTSSPNSANNSTDISGLIFYGSYTKDTNNNTNITYKLSDYKQTGTNNITYSEISGNPITSNLLSLGTDNSLQFYLRPIQTSSGGVYVSNGLTNNDNVITINLTNDSTNDSTNVFNGLTQYNVLKQINSQLNNHSLTKGSYVYNNSNGNTIFRLNINKVYTANDYVISFYDPYSFVNCYIGKRYANTTWDQTLGWILGFRKLLIYNLSETELLDDSSTINIKILTGDSSVKTNLYNYFYIELTDYKHSHINDGLVTISVSNANDNIKLPSYANKYTITCDNSNNPIYTGGSTGVGTSGSSTTYSTQGQIYAVNQQLNTRKNQLKSFTSGPYAQDLFAMIPIKPGQPGEIFTDSGGSLQSQDRIYFGPVNLFRFSVKLLTDRGELLNLNNANWGFSMICEQLYNQTI